MGLTDLAKIELRYVQAFRDRHGRARHYFRKPGQARIALPGAPGSAEFMEAYRCALAGETAPQRQVGAERVKAGTISALTIAYYKSAGYLTLRKSTQGDYRNILERFRAEHGDKPVALLQPRHVREIIAKRVETPAAANNLLKRLRALLQFAVDEEWIAQNPARDVKKVRVASEGYAMWSEAEIDQFNGFHPAGSRARLALALLIYTGQRRSDVVTMGRQHVRDGLLSVRQLKGNNRLLIPVHPALAAILAELPKDDMTYLMTAYGKPFSGPGFSNWFVDCAREAGLPIGRSPHGLRKAAARRLAEAGATTHQIAAVTGHKSLSEVERYTRGVDQARLATAAMDKLTRPKKRAMRIVSRTPSVKPQEQV